MTIDKDPEEITCMFNGADLLETLGMDVCSALYSLIGETSTQGHQPLGDLYAALCGIDDGTLKELWNTSSDVNKHGFTEICFVEGREHPDYDPTPWEARTKQ